jgi:hypothetical protein
MPDTLIVAINARRVLEAGGYSTSPHEIDAYTRAFHAAADLVAASRRLPLTIVAAGEETDLSTAIRRTLSRGPDGWLIAFGLNVSDWRTVPILH